LNKNHSTTKLVGTPSPHATKYFMFFLLRKLWEQLRFHNGNLLIWLKLATKQWFGEAKAGTLYPVRE